MKYDLQLGLVEFAVPLVQIAGSVVFFVGIFFVFNQVKQVLCYKKKLRVYHIIDRIWAVSMSHESWIINDIPHTYACYISSTTNKRTELVMLPTAVWSHPYNNVVTFCSLIFLEYLGGDKNGIRWKRETRVKHAHCGSVALGDRINSQLVSNLRESRQSCADSTAVCPHPFLGWIPSILGFCTSQ